MSLYRAEFKASHQNKQKSITNRREEEEERKYGVGPAIQALKAEKASCLSCSFLRSKPFGFNHCKKKDKNVKTYNICEFHQKKES